MSYGPKPQDPAERFWKKVDRSGDCWLWTAYRDQKGYGKFGIGSTTDGTARVVTACRFSWELHNGPIPPGMSVCHRCDNPPCCNPAHLFLGTQTDNNRDRDNKGRQPRGEARGHAKLTGQDVRLIRYWKSLGNMTYQRMADFFGVTRAVIGDVIHRRTWKHVA